MRVWHRDLKQIGDSLSPLQEFPILLLWGACDSAVYPASAYELHKRLANSSVLMMDGVGHLPYEEAPDEFNRIVCDFFLRRNPRTPLEVADPDRIATRAARPSGTPAKSELQSHLA
jgi:hypothetical protein